MGSFISKVRHSIFVDSGSYPARSGNLVRPLIDGIPAFTRISECIASAQHTVWATITFMWSNFAMPDGRGTALKVLNQAAERGLDVRLICWRPESHNENHLRNAFWGSPDQLALLADQFANVNIRWDKGAPGYCQHQKSWLFDAGAHAASAIVGGINLNPNSLVPQGHHHSHSGSAAQNHDVYVELGGPCVADVQHNFVQRWNEASERAEPGGTFGPVAMQDLPFPERVPAECGSAAIQIQRTTHAARYALGHPPVGGHTYPIAEGEQTNLQQYCAAIGAAARTIYIENQYLEVTPIVEALTDALKRGVEVLVVLPVVPDFSLREADITNARKAFMACRAALERYHNFMLCGLAAEDANGCRTPVYVHSKLMIVDGEFATVGSCNLHHYSLYGNGELNAAIDDSGSAMSLMAELFGEHVGIDIAGLDDLRAVQQFKQIAQQNNSAREKGSADWAGACLPYGYVSIRRASMTSVLLVCTGNIFRSMTAEYALRGNLTAESEIVVASAGIMHAPQASARSDVVEYLSGRGIDVSGHQRRTLSKQMIDSTDLVVAMNVDHKSRLLAEFGVESPLFMEMAGRGEMQLPDVDDLFPGGTAFWCCSTAAYIFDYRRSC